MNRISEEGKKISNFANRNFCTCFVTVMHEYTAIALIPQNNSFHFLSLQRFYPSTKVLTAF